MVMAENQYRSMAPTFSPINTFGVETSTVLMSAQLTKAPNSANDTSAADSRKSLQDNKKYK
ncbi:hypothetical protein Hanom_Chr09g00827981 [Helianthus anomalus]